MVVQGQIEINLRGLCKGRGIIQRAELQGVTSWPINVGLITPRAVMDTSGACARLSGIIARPSPSIHVSRVKRGDRERETRRGDEKNTGVTTINRFERRIDRKFSVPKHPVFRSTSDLGRRTYLERIHEFFPIVVRTCKWWSKVGTSTYTYIYIYRNIETFFSLLE